jgi:hypothetical protein
VLTERNLAPNVRARKYKMKERKDTRGYAGPGGSWANC